MRAACALAHAAAGHGAAAGAEHAISTFLAFSQARVRDVGRMPNAPLLCPHPSNTVDFCRLPSSIGAPPALFRLQVSVL